ncbi:hypothetical protein [Mesorhizobium sp. M0184]|uniref:hypothetical protein n=1 Tax=unclassified Mesorhizobium TaxID=325217 RepID=UPI003334F746
MTLFTRYLFQRIPLFVISVFYVLFNFLAPPQVLHIFSIYLRDERYASIFFFALPVYVTVAFAISFVDDLGRSSRFADLLVGSVSFYAIARLIEKTDAASPWLFWVIVVPGIFVCIGAMMLLGRLRLAGYGAKRVAELSRRWSLVTVLVMWALLCLVVRLDPISTPQALGIAVVTIGLGLLGATLTILWSWPLATAAYLGACLLASIVFGSSNDIPLTPGKEPGADASSDWFAATAVVPWLAMRGDLDAYKEAKRPYPVIISSAEGGGIYAAAHSYLALSKLQTVCPSFQQHLFASVGISGGGIGNLLFASAEAPNSELRKCGSSNTAVNTDVLSYDFLSPVLANLLIVQVADFFVPFIDISPDGGDVLANTIAASLPDNPRISEPLAASWRPDQARPAQVFVATDANSGFRFVIGSVPDLGGQTAAFFPMTGGEDIQGNRAAVTSARFPWLTSTARLRVDKDDYRILGDGGYFENAGADTAMEVVEQIKALSLDSEHCAKSEDATYEVSGTNLCKCPLHVIPTFTQTVEWKGCEFNVFLVYMPIKSLNSKVPLNDLESLKDADPRQSYLLDPLLTMISTRTTRGELAVSRARRLLGGLADPDNVQGIHVDGGYFPHELPIGDLGLPLGWRLSDAKVAEMAGLTASTDSCPFLYGKPRYWRTLEEEAKAVMEQFRLTGKWPEGKVSVAADETPAAEPDLLSNVKTMNGCNMSMLAWLFNPTLDPTAYGIPGFEGL